MLNPITQNKNYLSIYLVVWFVIITLHAVIVTLFYNQPWVIGLSDALVFGLIFMVFGYSLWYVIRFNLKENSSLPDLVLNHLFVALVVIAAWLALGYFGLSYLFPNDTNYLSFLKHSLPWRAVIGLFYYLLFVMFYYLMLYYDDLQEKLIHEAELQQLVIESQLSELKSQINPHFLFNSLNSISSLTITHPDKAQEMVIKLSDFLRFSLAHDNTSKNSLEAEFENMKRYLDIEKVRFGQRLQFKINIPESCLKFPIPNMILQPLIENAIKHGVYQSKEKTFIEITCRNIPETIFIEIKNNYDSEGQKPKGNGVGLKNIKKRMQLIYNRTDLLEVSKTSNEFIALLKLPKNNTNGN